MKGKSVNMILAVCFTILLGLTGCGGGGGGVSSEEIRANYKGATTQATVTQSNASVLSVDAMDDAQGSSDISGVLGKTVALQGNSFSALDLATVLEPLIQQSVAGKFVGKSVASIAERTVIGSGGGSANISVSSVDPIKGSVSGSVRFSFYKEDTDSPEVNGTVSFNGSVGTSGSIKQVDMTLKNVTVSGTESVTLFGTISIYNDSQKITLSLVETDNATSRTKWMKDFIFTLSGTSMTVAGTYFDHTHGWVTVSTVPPSLTVSDYGDTPTGGQLLFTGSKNTNARLTYGIIYSDGYLLEVDLTGTGSYTLIDQ
jgi:hypothetical protein